jgi:secreted trypsin-like serine protease
MTHSTGIAAAVGLGSLIALLGGCGAPPAVGSVVSPIINGTDDTNDPAVVMVLAQVPGSMMASLCTGEVVSPHVVLTAAHCVDPAVVMAGAQFVVFIGQQLSQSSPNSDFLTVKETHFLDGFDGMSPQNGKDVGVVILANPTTIVPVPYNRTPLPASMVGSPVRLVGYGLNSGDDTQGTSAGTRREAPTKLAHLDDLFVGLGDGSHGICEGDSGGPAFMSFDGRERIVGVTSFGFTGCPLTVPAGTPAGYEAGNDTRLDTYTDFIDKWVLMFDPPAKAPGDACSSDSDCTPRQCDQTSVGKICTQACDPAAMPSTCPAGTTCTSVDGTTLCVPPNTGGGGKGGGNKSGGCDVGGHAPVGGAGLLFGCALALWLARRRVRS